MNGIKIILFLTEKRLVEESDIIRTILFAQPSEFKLEIVKNQKKTVNSSRYNKTKK